MTHETDPVTGYREPTREIVSKRTGFDLGDYFESENDVRDWFTIANMRTQFPYDETFEDGGQIDQARLDDWASAVIVNRWHCRFSQTGYNPAMP